ncbi:hypothetical protein BpHYR1_024222 [Brachionus plicatilis]|uniref:Uncharacterized protein n=1 Tax=Brachionus plicatilis TaxID=10195 RepID=A0A3M7PEC3_BRAPC|nr:hypothetical protein BpHYR1_024222 [Brachionus plicatilis]
MNQATCKFDILILKLFSHKAGLNQDHRLESGGNAIKKLFNSSHKLSIIGMIKQKAFENKLFQYTEHTIKQNIMEKIN